jgi:hypothetical protein
MSVLPHPRGYGSNARVPVEYVRAYPEGFANVLVNGEIVIDHGIHTGARPGKMVYGPGAR